MSRWFGCLIKGSLQNFQLLRLDGCSRAPSLAIWIVPQLLVVVIVQQPFKMNSSSYLFKHCTLRKVTFWISLALFWVLTLSGQISNCI